MSGIIIYISISCWSTLIISSSDKKRRISKLPRLKCVCQRLQIFILNRNTIPAKYSESEELVASLEMADIIDKRLCMWAETVRLCLRNPRPSSDTISGNPLVTILSTNALLSSDQNQISSHHIKTLNWVETLWLQPVLEDITSSQQ